MSKNSINMPYSLQDQNLKNPCLTFADYAADRSSNFRGDIRVAERDNDPISALGKPGHRRGGAAPKMGQRGQIPRWQGVYNMHVSNDLFNF